MTETSKKNILLVDDDEDFLHLLSMRLQNAGFMTFLAQNGEEALTLLQTHNTDIVITDLQMDGMDGMTLFDNIRQTAPLLPVIIMTAHGSIPEAVSATQKGVFAFQTKPIDSQALIREIERATSIDGHDATRQQPSDIYNKWRKGIVSQSKIMEDLLNQTKLVANSRSNIFIHGESGTGKELLAQAIHQASPRAKEPFVAINCGAIPEALLESELFGHVKGSFSGATRNHIGLIKSADKGTLFLDEIGDTPLPFQIKLLRVIQERNLRPVGATKNIEVDIRIICATHRDIEEMVSTGEFREDLYYRLNVIFLTLSPLSERREDIPLLCQHFIKEIAAQSNKNTTGLSPDAMDMLLTAPWPGNVRQLYNVIEHAMALTTTPIIPLDLIQLTMQKQTDFQKIPTFDVARRRAEQEYLIRLLKMTQGSVTRAAIIAKRNRTDFYKILQRNHITPALFKSEKSE